MKSRALAAIAVAAALNLFGIAPAGHCADTPDEIIAYYFHGDVRCPTCRKLEEYSREAVQAKEPGQKVEFRAVNVDQKENEHFMTDYKLYTKSLVLSRMRDGKEVRSKNLTKIWEYVRDRKKFLGYVSSELDDFMKAV